MIHKDSLTWCLVFVVSAFVVLLAPCAHAAQATKPVIQLRAGCGDGKGSPYSNVQDKFAELVDKKSNGRIKIQVFYQSLGAEAQLTESVMAGGVDFGMISMQNTARFSNAFLMYDLPFLFKTNDDLLRHLDNDAEGKAAIQRFEKDTGLKVLIPMTPGSGRDVALRPKLAKTPADMKGMKIRAVSTPVDMAIWKAWGANPTPLDWGQLYAALQQGVVDGLGAPIGPITATKLHEPAKYITKVDYQFLVNNFYMSRKKFDSLGAEDQKILTEAAKEAAVWNRQDAKASFDGYVDQVKKDGGTYYVPTPNEYRQWASVREQVWRSVGTELGSKLDLDLANKIYAKQRQ